LPGADKQLSREHVVLTAHLDHLGITEPAKGDSIYNGALDNAAGVASMLEVAKQFQAGSRRPKRSVLFVALTAEEKGEIGSDFFARNPTVPRESLAANVNLDMPILTYRFIDLVAFGADRSTIGPTVAHVVASHGFKLTPDPIPDQAAFVRTDSYSFVKQGIPAVTLFLGLQGEGAKSVDDFLANHYHQPSDDLSLPIDWTAGVNFITLNYQIARALADVPERPHWNRGDYFGTLFNGIGAR
jgi:Zn-dependent M28 family amino/carboxypeptidase